MNAEQKCAWLGVISLTACIVCYLVLLLFFGPKGAFASFAIFSVNGFAPLIGRKEKPDERDLAIARRATLGGFTMSYLVFILGCMGTWIVVNRFGGEEYVSAHVLPKITILGGIVCYFTRSVAILVLYGRAVEADDV